MKAIKTKWFPPYVVKNNKLKPNLRIGAKKFNTGVYIVKDAKTNNILYVGYSGSNLYKTMYRHFQVWNDSQQDRIKFKKSGYKVRVIFCSAAQAQRLEVYLIDKYKPKFNKLQYKADFTEGKETGEASIYLGLNDIKTLNPGEEYPF
jgi:hypothetical protein